MSRLFIADRRTPLAGPGIHPHPGAPGLDRRGLLLGAAALSGLARGAAAAGEEPPPWPVRQVRMLVPFGPGSILDISTRIIAERLSKRLRATFVVDNKPGAGGGIGTLEVVRAAPDGATLLATSNAISILPSIQPRLGLDPARDLLPLALINDVPVALVARNDSPIRDLDGLVAKAKSAPGTVSYGTGGVGSANHLAGALFASMAGVELIHVPYAGIGRVATALFSGEIELAFGSTADMLPVIRQGGARLLGVSTAARMPELPDTPAIAEKLPGYAALSWNAFLAPKGLPAPLAERLVAELALLRDDPDLRTRHAGGQGIIRLDGPGPLASRIADDTVKWRTVIQRENIRAD